MKLIIDESADKQIVERLRLKKHHLWYIAEMSPAMKDDDVLAIANRKSASLLTSDKDFGELVFRQKKISFGVVLIRLAGMTPQYKAEIVEAALREYEQQIIKNFTVISPGKIRIRRIN